MNSSESKRFFEEVTAESRSDRFCYLRCCMYLAKVYEVDPLYRGVAFDVLQRKFDELVVSEGEHIDFLCEQVKLEEAPYSSGSFGDLYRSMDIGRRMLESLFVPFRVTSIDFNLNLLEFLYEPLDSSGLFKSTRDGPLPMFPGLGASFRLSTMPCVYCGGASHEDRAYELAKLMSCSSCHRVSFYTNNTWVCASRALKVKAPYPKHDRLYKEFSENK